MANSSDKNGLISLLSFQKGLRLLSADTPSATSVLPNVLISILETLGALDGRLVLRNLEPDPGIIVSMRDGLVDIETCGSLPDTLIEEYENIASQDSPGRITGDTRNREAWFNDSHPETADTPWSAIAVPIPADNIVMGFLTVLKPGKDQFNQEDILLCSLFAGQIGSMLATVQLSERMQTAEHQSQKLRQENQELAAILVHDLQGPLGNVLTSLEMVQDGIDRLDESGLSLMMDIAVRSSKHLQALVDSLLDISRLETGQKITDLHPIVVSDLVDFAAEVEGPNFEQRRVTLARELSPDLPLISANADIMQRVLLNLLDNALKASKQNQTITIRALVDDGDGVVRMHVEDQGPGIPQAYRERIFEKYQRVNGLSTSKGLGLGLAFCKLAVEAHGGQIWVEDSPNGGACFCLTIPSLARPASTTLP